MGWCCGGGSDVRQAVFGCWVLEKCCAAGSVWVLGVGAVMGARHCMLKHIMGLAARHLQAIYGTWTHPMHSRRPCLSLSTSSVNTLCCDVLSCLYRAAASEAKGTVCALVRPSTRCALLCCVASAGPLHLRLMVQPMWQRWRRSSAWLPRLLLCRHSKHCWWSRWQAHTAAMRP
jgi:hypothetical protein